MSEELPRFSTSEEVSFKTCRLGHFMEYDLRYRPVLMNRKLNIGIGAHEGLEVGYQGGSPEDIVARLEEWADEWWAQYQASGLGNDAAARAEFIIGRDLVKDMVPRYFEWVAEEGLDDDFETVEVEKAHYIEVPGAPCVMPVKFDLLQRNKRTGRLRLVDFKTRESFYSDTTGYQLAEQNGNYSLAVFAVYGEKPEAIVYRELRKMSPVLNPRSKPPYFREVLVRLTGEELLSRAEEYAAVARERFDPDRTIYSNPSACCGSWKGDYAEPCLLIRQGMDPEEALQQSSKFAPADPMARYQDTEEVPS